MLGSPGGGAGSASARPCPLGLGASQLVFQGSHHLEISDPFLFTYDY